MKTDKTLSEALVKSEENNEVITKELPGSTLTTGTKLYSDHDKQRIELFKEKRKKPRSPTFKKGNRSRAIEPEGGLALHLTSIAEAFGTTNQHLSHVLTYQVLDAAPGEMSSKVQNLNAALAVLHGIKPRDEIESLLATQMVGVHNLAMEFMSRAMFSEQTTEGVTSNTERATKMLRTFIAQMEALNRHRGKGQQKVTVEHVTVNSGGQAIVAQVNQSKTDDSEGRG